MNTDTIAAISTSPGQAGIGIVRISGSSALAIAKTVFRNRDRGIREDFPARKMIYGLVCEPQTLEMIDEALGVYMPGPHSYTGEDVFELQTHGSSIVLNRVLQLLVKSGARLANPGEFSLRSFLNGRIDLVQAEAVMQVIQAKSEASLRQAQELMRGDLSRQIERLRGTLLEVIVAIEAANDFPEEDVEDLRVREIAEKLTELQTEIVKLLSTANQGKVLRDGIRTVIAGKPNVGKSTLLNTLLGEERALVSAIPGTTRDTIEEWAIINGIPLQLIDTAGLRETDDHIERLGIERTREYLRRAELVLFLFDASEPPQARDMEIFSEYPFVPLILVMNKSDLAEEQEKEHWRKHLGVRPETPVVFVSATEKTGMDELQRQIEHCLLSDCRLEGAAVCLGSSRQQESLLRAQEMLQAALCSLSEGFPVDCCVTDLRQALQSLGQITGQSVSDEIVQEIFATFCLGK